MKLSLQSAWKDARGLSVLETLIATFLVSLVVVEVAAFFGRGRSAILEEGRKRDAVQVAQGELERLEIKPLAEITAGTKTIVVHGTSYNLTTQVTTDLPENGMKQVQLVVDWTTRRGKSRSLVLEAAYGEQH
jgi:hypothetical protein